MSTINYGYFFRANTQQDTYYYRLTSAEVETQFGAIPAQGILEAYYTPEIIKHNAITAESGKPSGKLDVLLSKNHPLITLLNDGLPRESIELYLLAKQGETTKLLFHGTIKAVEIDGEIATLNIASLLSKLSTRIPKIEYQRTCPWPLYSVQCGVNKSYWHLTNGTHDGTIGTISDDGLTITATAFGLKPDGWLNAGELLVEKTVGSGIYLKRTIISHTGTSIKLLAPINNASLGANFLAYAGCSRAHSTCKDKFDNVGRFGGCPWIPGKNVFVVGVL